MNIRIQQAKQELLDFIDDLNITESNYENILFLVQNCDDALFTKIMEEIKDGNLNLNDFTRIFKENDDIEKQIDAQEKLYLEQTLLRERLITLTEAYRTAALVDRVSANFGEYNDDLRLKNLTTQYANKDGDNTVAKASDIEKQNFILSVIDKPSDDPLEDLYKVRMLNKLLDTTDSDFVDAMLLSIHDYLVPVDYDHIMLSDHDKEFAKNNNMTEDDMRKMKSLAAFLSTYFE